MIDRTVLQSSDPRRTDTDSEDRIRSRGVPGTEQFPDAHHSGAGTATHRATAALWCSALPDMGRGDGRPATHP